MLDCIVGMMHHALHSSVCQAGCTCYDHACTGQGHLWYSLMLTPVSLRCGLAPGRYGQCLYSTPGPFASMLQIATAVAADLC